MRRGHVTAGMADMTDGNASLAEQGPPTTTIAEDGQYEGRTSPKRLARIAGVLYLLVAIFSAFAYFMEKKVYVSGDAATTTRNVIAHSGLVRTAVVADLLQATIWVFLAMTLYALLKHVNKNAASAMVVFVAIGAGITLLNEVFEFEGLHTGDRVTVVCGWLVGNAQRRHQQGQPWSPSNALDANRASLHPRWPAVWHRDVPLSHLPRGAGRLLVAGTALAPWPDCFLLGCSRK